MTGRVRSSSPGQRWACRSPRLTDPLLPGSLPAASAGVGLWCCLHKRLASPGPPGGVVGGSMRPARARAGPRWCLGHGCPPRGHVHVRSVSVRSPLTTWHCEQVRVGRYHRSAAATVDPCQWPGSGAGLRTRPCLYPRWPAARAFGRCAAHPACSRTAGRRGGRHLCEGTADCQAAKR
jgi:hypothetical protein